MVWSFLENFFLLFNFDFSKNTVNLKWTVLSSLCQSVFPFMWRIQDSITIVSLVICSVQSWVSNDGIHSIIRMWIKQASRVQKLMFINSSHNRITIFEKLNEDTEKYLHQMVVEVGLNNHQVHNNLRWDSHKKMKKFLSQKKLFHCFSKSLLLVHHHSYYNDFENDPFF